MSGEYIYLDHAAATPVDSRVFAAMEPYFSQEFFNPSSPYAPAVSVRREYEAAKARLAGTFGAKGDEIVITGGATESINLAFHGVQGHIVTSSIEHHAVLAAARLHEHTLIEPTEKGVVSSEAVKMAITPKTELVSIQLANNEIGTIQPLRDIAAVIDAERKNRAEAGSNTPLHLHTDASQGFGQIDVHVARLGVDMMTLNSGKMYGPKQIGLLWLKSGVLRDALVVGGGQERNMRSGTENVAGVMGFSKAAELALKHQKSESKRLSELRDGMQKKLLESFPDAVVSGHSKKRLPGSLHMAFPNLDGERLLFRLETRGVLVATGSACAANKGTRSHVLRAIGLSDVVADGSVRISLGALSDDLSVSKATEIISEEVGAEYERIDRV